MKKAGIIGIVGILIIVGIINQILVNKDEKRYLKETVF